MIGAGNLKTNKKGCCVLSLCHSSRLSLPFLSSLLEFAHRLSTAEDLPKEALYSLHSWEMIGPSKQEVAAVWFGQSSSVFFVLTLCYVSLCFKSVTPTGGMEIFANKQSLRHMSPGELYHHIYAFFLFRLMFFSWNRSFFWAHFKNI